MTVTMGAFIVYIIKSSLLLAMLVSLFMLFMSRETFHKLNRYLLLCIVVVSLGLPLVNIEVNTPLQGVFDFIENGGRTTDENVLVDGELSMGDYPDLGTLPLDETSSLPVAQADAMPVADVVSMPAVEQGSEAQLWLLVVMVVYGLGVVLLVIRQLVMYVQLSRIIMRSNKVPAEQYGLDGVRLRLHNGEEKPFSWFGWVVVSNKDMDEGAREILTHEVAHVKAGHSWDILLADAVIIMQWFNPLAWIMKNTLKDIHEFEADEAVISSGVNAKQYQLLIIKKAVGARLYSIANSFNHSLTKKRITMMCKEKSSKWSRAKALYILPVAAVAALSFSTVENANAEPDGKVNEFVADGTISGVENNAQVVEVDSICEIAQAPANDDPEKVFQVVEEQPEFPGGMKEMAKYIQSNLRYPEAAAKVSAEGKAFVQFVVKADGSISDVQIMRSSGNKALDDEALRVVSGMPKWKPAMNKGEAVNVKFVLPVVFKQQKEAPVIELKGGSAAVNKEHNAAFVVDGELYEGDIADINSQDIESITVVKKEQLSAEDVEKYNAGDKDGVIFITMKKSQKVEAVENKPEKMPEFPGGQQEMMKYLNTNTKYPKEARDAEVMGKVFVRFLVQKDGTIAETSVLKGEYSKYVYSAEAISLKNQIAQKQEELEKFTADGVSDEILERRAMELAELNVQAYSSIEKNSGRTEVKVDASDAAVKALEAEALRVVGSMPAWIPGMQDGKPVYTQFVLPIMFRLS